MDDGYVYRGSSVGYVPYGNRFEYDAPHAAMADSGYASIVDGKWKSIKSLSEKAKAEFKALNPVYMEAENGVKVNEANLNTLLTDPDSLVFEETSLS